MSCEFNRCDFSNAGLTQARFAECNFKSCKLLGLNWSLAEELRSPTFKDSNLSLSSFRGLKLKNLALTDCRVHEADFQDCDLSSSDLDNSDFQATIFRRCDLTKANFATAKNYVIDPTSNKIAKARFSLPEAVGLLHGLGITLEN